MSRERERERKRKQEHGNKAKRDAEIYNLEIIAKSSTSNSLAVTVLCFEGIADRRQVCKQNWTDVM